MVDIISTDFEDEFLNIEVGEMFEESYEIEDDDLRDKYIKKCLHYIQHKKTLNDKQLFGDSNIQRG